MPHLRRRGARRRALLPELQPAPGARAARGLLFLSRTASPAECGPAGTRTELPRAQSQVPPRLLLQRATGRTACQPRAIVVPERRVSGAAESGRTDRAPA